MDQNNDTIKLKESIDKIEFGRSILVIGAGFSSSATNINDKKMPTSGQLSDILSKEIGEELGSELEDISSLYIEEKGRGNLVKILKNNFTSKTTTTAQKLIANAPWKRVYTTNYDNVFERSCNYYSPDIITRTSSPKSCQNSRACIHLNGFIENIDEDNFDSEIMLTNEHYLTNELDKSPWAQFIRADFHSSMNIFFVGYSLYDFDITKILYQSNIKNKIFFIQPENLPRSKSLKFERYGHLSKIGIEDFSTLIADRKKDKNPDLDHGFLSNFREITFEDLSPEEPRIELMKPLLSKGHININAILWDISQNSSMYRVLRPQMERSSPEFLDKEDSTTFFITGNIGSGKKLYIEELTLRYFQHGYKCFKFDGLSEDISEDIEYLNYRSERDQVLVVFPDYYNHENLIKAIRSGVPKCILVTSSSVAALELSRTKPFDGLTVFTPINLEKLSPEEIDLWDKLLERNALWGEKAGNSSNSRKNFIKKSCKSQLRDLLLYLFDQEQIKSEIRTLFQSAMKEGKNSTSQMTKFLAISASNYDPSLSEVQEILGIDFAKLISNGKSRWVHELFSMNDGRRSITSAIFAQYLIREFVSDTEIIEELSDLAVNLDRISKNNRNFSKIRYFPLRYSFIERLFSPESKREKLVNYYEKLRQLNLGIRQPQFWLQYAIARMSFFDYDSAEDYFNTAYLQSKRRIDYDTYQIDNHYARFLIESSIYENVWNNSWDKFDKAHKIITKQMKSQEKGHYPYRVANLYIEFIEAFEKCYSNSQLETFLNFLEEIEEFNQAVAGELKNNLHVKRCAEIIPRAIEFTKEVMTERRCD